MDPRLGRFVNNTLSEYRIPVHGDIREIDAFRVGEVDTQVNPLG